MTQTILELYNALLEAGTSKARAKEASQAVLSREEAGNRLSTKEDILRLENKLDNKISKTKTEMIMWMVGLQIATVALIFSVLPNLIK
jgi:hypothetical protein